MRRVHRRSAVLVALAALVGLPILAAPAAAAGPPSEHDRIVAYWTRERIASARPRDLIRAPGGRVGLAPQPAVKPDRGGGGLGKSSGSLWPDGKGKVYSVVGRVLFTMDGSNWVCSGAAANDGRGDMSVVLTAAHCAYDNENKAPATNWMFFPEFDTIPDYDCYDAVYGCWTAERLVVHGGYANQNGFTSTATQHDWAFAVMRPGGKQDEQRELDSLGSYPISFTSYSSGTTQSAFGYPAGGSYSPGHELAYCHGSAGFDRWNANTTYRLSCNMTGGSSGGPWFVGFDATGNTGTLSSLNSYGYSGVQAMHGPKFNAKTQATWNAAVSGTVDIVN
jgi:hypothetical protein